MDGIEISGSPSLPNLQVRALARRTVNRPGAARCAWCRVNGLETTLLCNKKKTRKKTSSFNQPRMSMAWTELICGPAISSGTTVAYRAVSRMDCGIATVSSMFHFDTAAVEHSLVWEIATNTGNVKHVTWSIFATLLTLIP